MAESDLEAARQRIFQLCRGWWENKAFMVASRLGLFTALAGGPRDAAAVAAEIGAEPDTTELLLNAMVALGFLTKEGGRFANPPEAALLLVRGSDAYFGDVPEYADLDWDIWARLEERVRGGQPVGIPFEASDDEAEARRFIYQTIPRSTQEAERLAKALDLSQSRRLLDVAGGSGVFSIAFCRANPQLQVVLFDRPPVVRVTAEIVAQEGLESRIHLRGGDFLSDDLGAGYDTVFLSAVIHLLGVAENRSLVAKIFRSLESGGRLFLRDQKMNADRTAPMYGVMHSLHLRLTRPGARMYSFEEAAGWMKTAGFRDVQELPETAATAMRAGRATLLGVKP